MKNAKQRGWKIKGVKKVVKIILSADGAMEYSCQQGLTKGEAWDIGNFLRDDVYTSKIWDK